MKIDFDELDTSEIFYFGLKVAIVASPIWIVAHHFSTRLPGAFSLNAELNKQKGI